MIKTYEQFNKILYCAVVLTDKSRSILLSKVSNYIPEGWKTIAHHMTIQFGKSLEDVGIYDEGQTITLRVKKIGISNMAIAVEVEGYKTFNNIPHITIAVNIKEGGKPFMSNKITDWEDIEEFEIEGIISNI